MKKNTRSILTVLLVMVLLTLACNLPISGKNKTENEEVVSLAKVNKDLGDVYRSVEGGFSFQSIPEYEMEEAWGIVSMSPPGVDPEIGPIIYLVGGLNTEEKTAEIIKDDFVAGLEGEIDLSKVKKVKIDGKEGIRVEFELIKNDQVLVGQAIFIAVTPYQVFSMIDFNPSDQYKSKQKDLFEEVSKTITFFEPSPLDAPAGQAEPGEEIRQWAIYGFASSEYDSGPYSASQAVGAPDTLTCGDYVTAWKSIEKFSEEWIEVGFFETVIPTEINIYESNASTQITKVEIVDSNWNYYVIYEGTPESTGCPYQLNIPIQDADHDAIGVKITIDQTRLDMPWDQIDAVELVGVLVETSWEEPSEPESGQSGQTEDSGQVAAGPIPEYASGSWDFIRTEDGLADPIVRALAAAPDGSLWIGYGNQGIANYKNGSFKQYTSDQGLTANSVTSLAVESDGTLWVGTGWGVSRFDGSGFTNYLTDQGLLSNSVNSLAIAPDGSLWVGVSSGVSNFNGTYWVNHTTSDGLGNAPVLDIAFDQNGGTWFASQDGVSYMKDGRWKVYNQADGLAYKFVNSVITATDGSTWFATGGQGASRFDGSSWSNYRSDEGLTYNTKDMAIAADGSLWITSDGYGVFRYNGNSFESWSTADGLLSNWVDIITAAPDGTIWVNFKDGGIGRFGN